MHLTQLTHEFELKAELFYQLLYRAKQILDNTPYRNFYYYYTINVFPFIDQSVDLNAGSSKTSFSRLDFGYNKALNSFSVSEIAPHTEQLIQVRLARKTRQSISTIYHRYKLNYVDGPIVISPNELMTSYFSGKMREVSIPLLRPQKIVNIDRTDKDLVDSLYQEIVNLCPPSITKLNTTPIFNMVKYLISRTKTDLGYIAKLPNKRSRRIFSSSGGGYFNLLSTHFKDFSDAEIIRFAHGGERVFFDDKLFWDYELKNIDVYYTYGTEWESEVRSKSETGFNLEIHSEKSHHLTNLRQKHPQKLNITKGKKPKILLVGLSYVGEAVQSWCKLSDKNQYYLEKSVCNSLSKFGQLIYRKHPKGHATNAVNELSQKITLGSKGVVSEDFDWADVIFVTYFGTLAVEAVLSGKKVVYLDLGIRPISSEYSELAKVIDCLKITQDDVLLDVLSDYFLTFETSISETCLADFILKYYNG
jgi:hypothetical protein